MRVIFEEVVEALNLSIYCKECRGKMKRFRKDGGGTIHVCQECGNFEKED